VGDIPEEQQPGHRPDEDQDKPDLDAFAERLGVASEGDEPGDAPSVTREGAGANRWQPQWRRVLVPAAVVTGLFLAGILRRRRS
jgi:hypothetical protein